MKVILDTNIFISFLLAPGNARTITQVVDICVTKSSVTLIIPPELLAELSEKVLEKSYLKARILQADLDEFLEVIKSIAIIPPKLADMPLLSPDPDDDYLLAHGLLEEVDYIVTGDAALLALGQIDALKIVDATTFGKLF
ncbi:MAG: putative toxin-antitoxin system toxin component, PIN family [Caldilineaceae bacterium]|nr:putative toxin-antitoxin system toxin component, PIN family [Caldilineaceae bacterium]